jgi:hypothetical protein
MGLAPIDCPRVLYMLSNSDVAVIVFNHLELVFN